MKITIWIRADKEGRNPKVRTDFKYETYDTPPVQRVGRKILDALEGNEDKNNSNR